MDIETHQRLRNLERATLDLCELVRYIGQELSWTAAGASLNNPPNHIREAQARLHAFYEEVRAQVLAERESNMRSNHGNSQLRSSGI